MYGGLDPAKPNETKLDVCGREAVLLALGLGLGLGLGPRGT